MVALKDVQSSNSRIASALPDLVAVFVGSTSGIGEYTLREFARNARRPRVYFVGRSQEAGDRLTTEFKALSPGGDFNFIKADTSLIRNVDDVCRDIKSKEKAINILWLSTGTMNIKKKTSENLLVAGSLVTYSRNRFILNLLPLLQQATCLRRVVSCFAATKEGPVDVDDMQGLKIKSPMTGRGHLAAQVTLSLEALARIAPTVSFVHDFPGFVKTNLIRGGEGLMITVMDYLFKIAAPLIHYMPERECGERHLYLLTSARYPAAASENDGASTSSSSSSSRSSRSNGVSLDNGVSVARGIYGEEGSGVYSIDARGESAGAKVEELFARLRTERAGEKVWKHMESEWERITGGSAPFETSPFFHG